MPELGVAQAGSPCANIIAEDFLRCIEKAFAAKDVEAVETLFLPNGQLRECVLYMRRN
jgi:hypothetical protein